MDIDRRTAIITITAALEGIAKSSWGCQAGGPVGVGEASASLDLSQIGTHVYSEEGIPMFLGCEDIAAPQTRQRPSDLNRKVSSAFERCAQEWRRLHPDADARDAAKLVEFLAGRDFANGGLETSL